MPDGGRASDVKVGAFVLVALGTLVAGSLWIAGSSFLGPSRVDYDVLMKDSGGLQAGDRVRIAGVNVGRVKRIDLHPGDEWPVRMAIAVRRELAISRDASAAVGTAGLLGAGYLEIDPGTPGADRLEEGGKIHGTSVSSLEDALASVEQLSAKAMELMGQLGGVLETVSGELEPIASNLHRLLSDDNTDDLVALLGNLRRTTDQSGPRLASLLDRMNGLAQQLEEGVEAMPELSSEMRDLVAGVHTALGPEGERLTRLLDSAESGLGRVDRTLALVGDNRGEIEATLRDLRDTLANLKSFSQTVKERPYSLVRIKPEPDRRPGDGN